MNKKNRAALKEEIFNYYDTSLAEAMVGKLDDTEQSAETVRQLADLAYAHVLLNDEQEFKYLIDFVWCNNTEKNSLKKTLREIKLEVLSELKLQSTNLIESLNQKEAK